MKEALMRELRGVVYRFKRTGPRTEPWRTLKVSGDEGELCEGISTVDVRDKRYEVNYCSETENDKSGKKAME